MNGNMTLYCIKYAQSTLPENLVFYGGKQDVQIPICFAVYLIDMGKRKILVDAGCETMPGFLMEDFISPQSALESIGVFSHEITDVIITHAHHDHIEALKHFEGATLYITGAERELGEKYIPKNMKVVEFDGEYAIAQDVMAVEIGGHSRGSAIVELTVGNTVHILAGDECYTDECINLKIPTGSFCDFEKSRNFIEKYADEKYCVHTCHDISLKTERIM